MHGLLVDVGEDHADALFGALVIQVLQRVEGRDVQRVDHVHADDQTAGELLDGDLADALGHAEKQGAADLVHPHVEGHLRQLILRHVLVLPAADLRLVAHALHEQQGGQQHAHLDGHYQIEDHRQQEGQHQHQIHQQKQTAAIFCGKVREPPQVADTHRTSGGSKDKSDLSGETACFLFHDSETPIHISYCNIG